VALLAALLVLAGLPACSRRVKGDHAGKDGTPTAVVLISLDTLRADRLAAYGYGRETSPTLSAFAREGLVMEVAGAQAAQTLISHKSLFSGKNPLRLIRESTRADLDDLTGLKDPSQYVQDALRDHEGSLVTELSMTGYDTAAFTDGGWMSRDLGFDEGFDAFNDEAGELVAIVPRVIAWLRKNAARPFFLLVHSYDVHCPYPCREPYDSEFCHDHSVHVPLEGRCGKPDLMGMDLRPVDLRAISDHYDGGIASADAYVGEIFAELRRLGIYDEALIVVTSDHGESLGEHDQIGHGGLYLEQLLVPLLIKLPASWAVPPQRIPDPVALVDVLPTILSACQVPLPAKIDGHSLLPLIWGRSGGRRHLVAQMTFREGRQGVSNPTKRALLDPGRWLLIHDASAKHLELFDLAKDPKGLTPALDPPAGVTDDLLAVLTAYDLGRSEAPAEAPQSHQVDEKLQQQLKALGYVE
jgi:arylsulfatase A-like enzyme